MFFKFSSISSNFWQHFNLIILISSCPKYSKYLKIHHCEICHVVFLIFLTLSELRQDNMRLRQDEIVILPFLFMHRFCSQRTCAFGASRIRVESRLAIPCSTVELTSVQCAVCSGMSFQNENFTVDIGGRNQ